MKDQFPRGRPLRLLALVLVTLAVISSVQSALHSPPTARVDGCEASPPFTLPAELNAAEPLKVKAGDYSLGQWRTSGGVVEVKIAVSKGRKTDTFITLNGRRLKAESIGQVPKKIEDCARKLADVTEPRTVFDLAMGYLVQSADAATCKTCKSFRIVRDCNEKNCIYWLVGCGHVCGKSVGPPLS